MEALGINIGYLLMQILGITVLILILRGVAYQPILRILDERKARIAKGLEDARQAAIARDNADAEAKKILDAARAEAAKVRSEATVQAEETASGILANARVEAKKIVDGAAEDAEAERERILSDLRGQVVNIAMAASSKIVGESLDEQRQRRIVGDFLAGVPASVSGLKGDRAEVVSALPLTDDEKAQVEKQIDVETVSYRVDPGILGGLIIRVGDQVIDDSVASRAVSLREQLAR